MAGFSLSARDRRALWLGALLVLPALGFVFAVRPYLAALDSTRDQLAAERGALARERAAVAAAERNPEYQLVADSLMRAAVPTLFSGRDDVMATAELVSYLGAVANENDVWLQNATTRPSTTTESGVRALHVALRAESDLAGLLRFLRALEQGDRLLRVERLDVSVRPTDFTDSGVEPVTIAATVTAFALPGAQP
jgi:hypothetical protein